jgi:hypothetical protein
MGMVIAVREESESGLFIGFKVDAEILECSECTEDAAYRLRYPSAYKGSLAEYRFKAHRIIAEEHPNHSDQIRIA